MALISVWNAEFPPTLVYFQSKFLSVCLCKNYVGRNGSFCFRAVMVLFCLLGRKGSFLFSGYRDVRHLFLGCQKNQAPLGLIFVKVLLAKTDISKSSLFLGRRSSSIDLSS